MTQDEFDIDFIYATKANTQSWFMDNDDPEHDSRFYIGSTVGGLTASGSYWKCDRNDQVRLNAQTPQAVNMDNSDGGCNMDFAAAEAKGNTGMTDRWRDIEMTAKINVNNFSPSDGRFIMKGPTFHHHQDPCCSGHAYGVRFFFAGALTIQFFKEIYHSHYESRPSDPIATDFATIMDGQDHNLKFVRYNKVINGIQGVVLEAYVDFDADGKNFVKVGETVDVGGWNDGGDQCNGDDDQILTWGSGWAMFRWDASSTDLKFKDWSTREIDPTISPEQSPTDPIDTRGDETALVIPLVLTFDVNALRDNPCAVAGGGPPPPPPSEPFYSAPIDSNNPKILSNTSGNDFRKRAAAWITDTGSDAYNKKPVSCDFALAKVGTPAAASVFSKIWDSANNVVYTSPTSYTDASLTTTLTYKNFDYSTNTRFLKVNDRIGVEYINADGSNYVITCYISDIAGNGTKQSQYEGSVWDDNSREQSCRLY